MRTEFFSFEFACSQYDFTEDPVIGWITIQALIFLQDEENR